MKNSGTAIFGSAFNPPHLGHGDVLSQILEQFESVILVPSFQHAFGKKMMPFALRVKMTKALVADLHLNPLAQVSEIEKSISQSLPAGSPIYTYDVLDKLEQELESSDLSFVVGPDNAAPETWKKFNRSEEILARWRLWPAQERVKVRSTLIRDKLSKGALPTPQECSPSVIQLLSKHICE